MRTPTDPREIMRDACARRPLRILVDCDGVLADFVGLVLRYVERTYGMRPQREAIDQWDCFKAIGMGECWPAFRSWCDTLGECRAMVELPGGRELWAECLRLGAPGMVKVCTTPMTVAWLSQRAAWLEAFGVPLGDQIQVHGKEALAGGAAGYDVLIDDKLENCRAFVDAGGRAFCIAAAYNAHAPSYVPRGGHTDCIEWLRALARGSEAA